MLPYLINTDSRAFVRDENEAYKKHSYYACVTLDGLTQSITEVATQQVFNINEYAGVADIISGQSQPSINIASRLPRNVNSPLYKISNLNVISSIQVHFGNCYSPTTFSEFDESLVLEDVKVTSYSVDKFGALESGEKAIINESATLNVGRWYYIRKIGVTNIGSTIISDGFQPISMDILTRKTYPYMLGECILLVLAYDSLNPLTTPMRVYITEDNGRIWRYVALPLLTFTPTQLFAKFTTISAFENYVYLHIRIDDGLSSESRIFNIPTKDLLHGDGLWALGAVNGENDCLPSTDRIIKFQDYYYAPYVNELTPALSYTSRIVRYDSNIANNLFTPIYVPKTNAELDGSYSDTPIFMYNYQDEMLFTGIYIGVPELDFDPRIIYIAYTVDGSNWLEIPIRVNGSVVTMSGTRYIKVLPINKYKWLVNVSNGVGGDNRAFYTVNAGKNWVEIASQFNGTEARVTYAPTQNVFFTSNARSYDGGITSVSLPDNNSDYTYSSVVLSVPGSISFGTPTAMGYGDPNVVYTYGYEGVYLFN